MAERRKGLALAGLGAVMLGIGAALLAQFGGGERERVLIGAKGFSEQYVLARLIGQQLQSAGFAVGYRDGLGSAVAHGALASGEIDILVDYTGTIWTNQMRRDDNPGRDAMLAEIARWEAQTSGTRVVGRLGFENAYAFAMREDRARALGVEDLADLARVAPRLTVGGDPEFFERPEWAAVRDAYGLRFARQRNFSPTFMYNALQSGEADVIGAYTSDGRIAANRLRVLADPHAAFPNYDAVLLVSPARADDAALLAALEPLIGAIDVHAMREANYAVDRDKEKLAPHEAARALAERIGL